LFRRGELDTTLCDKVSQWWICSDDVANRRLTVADTVVSSWWDSAGVHSRTNIYIDPSNNDWIIPKHNIFGSKNRENTTVSATVRRLLATSSEHIPHGHIFAGFMVSKSSL
jgi:hypothetical protein